MGRHGDDPAPLARVVAHPDAPALGAGRRGVPDRVCAQAQGADPARGGTDPVRSRVTFFAGRSRPRSGRGDHSVPQSDRGQPNMNFLRPTAEELAGLRADPLLWEQELDVRPEVAESLERATGMRAGRVYWRSNVGHLYAL